MPERDTAKHEPKKSLLCSERILLLITQIMAWRSAAIMRIYIPIPQTGNVESLSSVRKKVALSMELGTCVRKDAINAI